MTTDSPNWYYRDFARTAPINGPFTLVELAERAQTGELAYDVLVRCGNGEWLQADRVTELIVALRQRRIPERETDFTGETDFTPTAGQAVPARRRRLNWVGLFIVSAFLGAIGGLLLAIGLWPLAQLIWIVASVTFLCAIIRWAIEPLFAQLVNTNDQLSHIAKLLRDKKDE